jgi:hypothetical protein
MRRVVAWSAVFLGLLGVPAWAGGDRVHYGRDVRPILSDACYQCHGPDAGTRKARLRLDTAEGLTAERDTGAPVVPGEPEESVLIERILSEDDAQRMPPPGSGKALTPEQVDILRRWIAQGAETRGHWAYEPPTRPAVPGAGEWARGPIDAFVAEGHSRQGLSPAPEADRATLLRRVSLDLTGLPPTPAELNAFLSDARPDAYERQVERLLASPRFGERMGQYWLDLVRYADTVGYHGDNHQEIWLYRDYVIDAFNRNVPFDRFTAEQLAGDLLPDADRRTRVASGYNRLLMTTREGGAQAKEYEAKYAADRVRNVSSVWLGATLGCAQCHDHKYDPYTTRDFYAMAAYFADLKETAVGEQEPTRIPSDEQASEAARLDVLLAAASRHASAWTPALDASLERWEAERRMRLDRWTATAVRAIDGDAARLDGPDAFSTAPVGPGAATYTAALGIGTDRVTALRLVTEPVDGTRPGGACRLTEITVSLAGKPVAIRSAEASIARRGEKPGSAIDGDPTTAWTLANAGPRPAEIVFLLDRPVESSPETSLVVTLRIEHSEAAGPIRLRLDTTDDAGAILAERPLPDEIEAILAVAPGDRDDAQRGALAAYYRAIAPELALARAAVASLQAQRQRIEQAMPVTLVSEAMAEPRVVRVLPRGNWLDETGEVVAPAPPSFLAASLSSDRRLNRLDLARWLGEPSNPLVARVFVNRVWKLAFGRGLVATADDFGAQGVEPSHPELLDWLATDFVGNGWDVKRLWRAIVTSATYRQSSRASEELRRADPDNVWVARQGRVRLDAELIRDQALAASGLLVERLGGPSAKPYQPAGYWSYLNFPVREYEADRGAGLYRRGLYTYWCRTFLHPSLMAFDAPTREECTVDRPRSNTPIQALVLLNDPIYVELARSLAERVIREAGGDPAARIGRAYELLLARPARPEEVEVLQALYDRHRSEYAADPAGAAALLKVGERPAPADLPVEDLAATTSVMRAILNLHETLVRY